MPPNINALNDDLVKRQPFSGAIEMSAYQIGSLVGTMIGVLVGVGVALLLYKYLGKGAFGKSGNRGEVSRQKIFTARAVLIVLCAILLIGFAVAMRTRMQQNSSHTYPENVVNEFTKGCVNNAKANLEVSIAERVCSCTITEVQKGYTFGEFKSLSERAEKNGEVPSELRDALLSCARKESITGK